jgi:hypothetical protein
MLSEKLFEISNRLTAATLAKAPVTQARLQQLSNELFDCACTAALLENNILDRPPPEQVFLSADQQPDDILIATTASNIVVLRPHASHTGERA